MKCPCTADCPGRHPGCRGTCPYGFQEYEAQRLAKGNAIRHSGASDYLHEKGQKMKEICRARRHNQ